MAGVERVAVPSDERRESLGDRSRELLGVVVLPLNEVQKRMLVGERFDPRGRRYTTGIAFEIAGELDRARFEEAFGKVVADFDALSLVLDDSQGEPRFVVRPEIDRGLKWVDLTREVSPRHALRQWLARAFPPQLRDDERLFAAHLIAVEPRLHVFSFAAHHAISDGGCYTLLIERLAAHYRGVPLAPAPSYVELLSKVVECTAAPREAHPFASPFPFRSSPSARYAAGTVRVERRFGRERTERLRAHLRRTSERTLGRATAEFGFTACAAYLGRRYAVDRFDVGFPVHRRTTPELRATFGLLMRPEVFEIDVSPALEIEAVEHQLSHSIRSVLDSDAPFSNHRGFDIGFNAHTYRLRDFAGLPMRVRWMHRGSDPIPLQFHLRGFESESLSLAVDANRAEFSIHEALRIVDRVIGCVDTFLESPRCTVGSLDVVTPRERSRILSSLTGPEFEATALRIDERLLAESRDTRVIHGDAESTQFILRERAFALAERLRAAGIGPGATVAIEGERGLDQLAAIQSVVLSGAAFVPLDPRWPAHRIETIREDARIAATIRGDSLEIVDPASRPLASFVAGSCDDPLYVLYTSGSTGIPKGVIGTHRGLSRRIDALQCIAPLAADDVVLLRTPIGFVDSVAEMFTSFLLGASAVLLDDTELRDPDRILAAIERHRVTRLVLTPSLLRALLDRARDGALRSLRVVVSSGEELSIAVANAFHRALPTARLLNLYGSTEVAADVTWCDATTLESQATRVPIGVPLAGNELFLLDDSLRLVPHGALGEIVVAGECLARGYLSRPRDERERFITHPLDVTRRAYRTGDFGVLGDDGRLEYHGRRDRQVKVRGVRIELEEVEAAIAAYPGVVEVAVEASEKDGAGLHAFVVWGDPLAADPRALRAHVASRVPPQGIPREFVSCERLPRMSHGKIDRAALETIRVEASDSPAPASKTERRILAILGELLPSTKIDRDDDFFAVGGDSLLAVDAVIALEREFGRPIAIADFMKDASPRGLAAYFDSERTTSEAKRLPRIVRLGGPVDGIPTICVPPAGSDPSCFLALARRFEGSARGPLLGLVPLGIEQGETPDDRVEVIAERYLEAIVAAVGARPIRLIGRCFGGIVAFEMSRQAQRHGIEVERLVLLDTRRPPGVAVEMRRAAAAGDADGEEMESRAAVVLRRRAARAAHFAARARYQGGPSLAPTILVHCGESSTLAGEQEAWTRFLKGELVVRHFAGEHKRLMREPRVAELANFLRKEIE